MKPLKIWKSPQAWNHRHYRTNIQLSLGMEMEGVRFLYDLLANMRGYSNLEARGISGYRIDGTYQTKDNGKYVYDTIIRELDDPNTKRILFDARQAQTFIELGIEPPQHIQSKLRFPFEQFYMEFTEPIRLAQEPGFDDLTRAIVVAQDVLSYEWNAEYTGIRGSLSQATVFQTAWKDGGLTYVDRTFKFDLEKGWVMVPISVLKELGAEFPTELAGWKLDSQGDQYWPIGMRFSEPDEGGFNIVRAKPEDWIWYERAVYQEATLLYWCIAYMMAKSIVLDLEMLPRHERRRLQREGKIPEPWHVVKVNPKIILSGPQYEEGAGRQHRYRYDVIGHLRFGRHPRKDGSYSDTIEWIAPHQRGLVNSLYIPKTYKVEKGRTIAGPMMEYFRDTKEQSS